MRKRQAKKNARRFWYRGHERAMFGAEHAWANRRGARWRELIRSIRKLPPEPMDLSFGSYPAFSFTLGGVHRHGSFSTE